MSMTLLAINNYYYPRAGAEMVYLHHNRLFESAGWSVVPFAMQHAQNLPSRWDRHFVEEIELGSQYSLTGTLRRVPRVVYSFDARTRLRGLLRECRPNIAHVHNIYHHISPSILSLLRAEGIPTVLTLHDLKLACPAYKMLTHDGVCERCQGNRHRNLLRHRCIKGSLAFSTLAYVEAKVHRWLGSYAHNVDRFIAPSRFFMRKLIEWGMDADALIHIPNTIPLDAYTPPVNAGRHFVYVGRLAPEKGLATLIRACAVAGVSVQILGRGPEEGALQALAQASDAKVTFLGHVSGPPLRQALRAARALVLPSEWYENAPISVLEAYRDGIPVIGASIGGIPELIDHGVTGLTFESGSVDALAVQLATMAAEPDARVRAMGDAGRQRVEAEHCETRYFERVRQLYERLGVVAPAVRTLDTP